MSKLADEFTSLFREEHRAVRDALLDLVTAFEQRRPGQAPELLQRIARLTGPHFRYEEEALYPALVQIFGRAYVRRLFTDHDTAIHSAQRLMELAGRDSWSEAEAEEGVALVRGILPHVSDCDGLSIMVERLPDEQVSGILAARERSNAAGLDLLSWARLRQSPVLPAA